MSKPNNPLDELLSEVIGERASTIEETTTSEKTITSTVSINVKTVRSTRSRYFLNVPDERVAALIEEANATCAPIRDSSGEVLSERLAMHLECVQILQGLLIEHSRNAIHAGLSPKISKEEIAAFKKEREEQRAAAREKDAKKTEKTIKKIKKEKELDKLSIYDKLSRSSDPVYRAAGKFVKNSPLPELQALKSWNDMMSTVNPGAVVKNPVGVRLDVAIEANAAMKKEGK